MLCMMELFMLLILINEKVYFYMLLWFCYNFFKKIIFVLILEIVLLWYCLLNVVIFVMNRCFIFKICLEYSEIKIM